jgi:hypothetical protein
MRAVLKGDHARQPKKRGQQGRARIRGHVEHRRQGKASGTSLLKAISVCNHNGICIMPRTPNNPGTWPRLMRAATAAAYCDEVSVEAFMRRVGLVYSPPVHVFGRGKLWLKSRLDRDIESLGVEAADVPDAAELL